MLPMNPSASCPPLILSVELSRCAADSNSQLQLISYLGYLLLGRQGKVIATQG
jgi:hypothetical protein